MEAAARAAQLKILLDETEDLERDARSIQEHRPSTTSENEVRAFRDRYQTWYATGLELLPDDLRVQFIKEYEGGRFIGGISAFIVAPAQPNAVFARAAVENPDALSAMYWQYPVQTTFEPRFIKQQALLRQAQQRFVQLSTIPASPISGIANWGSTTPTSTSGHGDQQLADPASDLSGKPVVFIAHGRSLVYLEVYRYLKEELGLEPVHFETEDHTSEQLSEILGHFLSQAVAAVVVMTGEDQTIDNRKLARQNVVHEAGLFQARLGFGNVVPLKETGVEQFSNAQDIIYIPLDPANAKASFYDLGRFFSKSGPQTRRQPDDGEDSDFNHRPPGRGRHPDDPHDLRGLPRLVREGGRAAGGVGRRRGHPVHERVESTDEGRSASRVLPGPWLEAA